MKLIDTLQIDDSLRKSETLDKQITSNKSIQRQDELWRYTEYLLSSETERQNNNITLIASEWAMMHPVRTAISSIFAEKYFEGTPSNESLDRLVADGLISRELVKLKRPGWFSPGCSLYDDLSWLCQSSVMDLFDDSDGDDDGS